VVKLGQTVAPEALIEFVGQRIARYKKPKHVVFAAALPRTQGGIVDRAAVKAAHGAA
jgi:long-chain acyl-CoA synthetase